MAAFPSTLHQKTLQAFLDRERGDAGEGDAATQGASSYVRGLGKRFAELQAGLSGQTSSGKTSSGNRSSRREPRKGEKKSSRGEKTGRGKKGTVGYEEKLGKSFRDLQRSLAAGAAEAAAPTAELRHEVSYEEGPGRRLRELQEELSRGRSAPAEAPRSPIEAPPAPIAAPASPTSVFDLPHCDWEPSKRVAPSAASAAVRPEATLQAYAESLSSHEGSQSSVEPFVDRLLSVGFDAGGARAVSHIEALHVQSDDESSLLFFESCEEVEATEACDEGREEAAFDWHRGLECSCEDTLPKWVDGAVVQTLALSVRVLDYLSSCVADGQDAIETNRGTLEDERVDGGAQRSRLV